MSVTLAQAQQQLEAWTSASLALADGQSFSMNGRSLSLTDASEVREMINYWSGVEARLLNAASTGKQRRASIALSNFNHE